jgi:HCOMODA/2-hydroxy-3-carboxy-muconic semialdehyde decarboxylase
MSNLQQSIAQLVAANRILANQGIVDAYGHVSIRHPEYPDRYLLARSLSPELVQPEDILEFHLDGEPVQRDGPTPYLERFIHGGVYERRPEINAVIHSHADAVLPFTISDTPLVPVIHTASDIGAHIPVWDIRDRFGDTNLLVVDMEQGRDLALGLGNDRVVLMRGHGFTATGRSLVEVVKMAIYLPRNATIQMQARMLGQIVKPLSAGEIAVRSTVSPNSPQMWRAWEYWCKGAGVDPGPPPAAQRGVQP